VLPAALFNFMALIVATGQRRLAAGVVVLMGALAYQSYLVLHASPLEAGVFLAEGLAAGLAIFLCARTNCRPGFYYLWGLLPTLALIVAVFWIPQLRDTFQKELADSWRSQGTLFSQFSKGRTPELDSILRWVQRLFPAYWALAGLFRIWLSRYAVMTLAGRRQQGMGYVRFVDFRLHDAFLYLLAAGLLSEVFEHGQLNLVGHNMLVFTGSLYLLQGFAVVHSFFLAYKVSVFLIMLFYALTIFTQIPLAVVAVVGLSDVWLGFRNRLVPSDRSENE